MDKEFKKLFKESAQIKLDQKDRTRIRENLYQFMEGNPISESPKVPLTILFRRHAFVFTALIIIFGTAGLSFTAEGSVPGGIFYPIKQMNERIVSSFIFSEEAKLQWEIRKVERRLEEAEKLASKENLKEKYIVYLEEDFEERAQMINSKIAEFEVQKKMADAAEFSSHFETSLRAHDNILTKIIKSKSAPENEVEPLILNIRAKTNLASRVRAKTEDAVLRDAPMGGGGALMLAAQSTSAPSELDLAVQERLADTEKRIEKVQEMLQKNELSEETIAKVQTKIDWARELIKNGEKHLSEGVISKSFLLAQQANRIVHEIEILIKGYLNLFNDVNTNKGTISIKDCEYPILESFPRQCATPDGNLVIKEDLEIEIPR